ncbi:MAG: phytoene desaturase family protein [Rubrobacteraceae bacterium]
MSRVVVVGGGISGLTAAALIGHAGHQVTLLEGNSYLGGKSRRIHLSGQRIDTGPSLFTFPGVWNEFLSRLDTSGSGEPAAEVAGLELRRMPEVGTYHYRDAKVSLPVPEEHPWYPAWERFSRIHGGLGPDVTQLLTADPLGREALPALKRLLRTYGARLTTRGYLDSLPWLPEGLREILAIHTLNAGVSPSRSPALYASMPAIMAADGVWAPEGGIYEVVLALEKLARHAGVEIKTEEPAMVIESDRVTTPEFEYAADVVVGSLDAGRLENLLDPAEKTSRKKLSCSGIAVYAALENKVDLPPHSVVLPTSPKDLYESLEAGVEPAETMAFANYYAPGEVYPNAGATLGLLLTAPPNGREYALEDKFVEKEINRVSREIGLEKPANTYFTEHAVLHPRYFGSWGGAGGALYGAARPFWQSGPFHRPRYSDRRRPWLWRVGASVHPGGGIPAVLGGAMISVNRLLDTIGRPSG